MTALTHKKDFMCRCSDEERQKSQECLDRVKKELNASDANLLSKVVFELNWGFGADHWRVEEQEDENYWANITKIVMDQWSLVRAEVVKDGEACGTISVQCDNVEDGIARVWELAKEIVQESNNGSSTAEDKS